MQYNNPYGGEDFFGFFYQLLLRLFGFLSGSLNWDDLVSDEIQILVLVGVAISGALVGSFLVLRKMTMLANSLSHTILLGIVIAFVTTQMATYGVLNLQSLMIAAFAMSLITTFLTEFLTKWIGLQEDASIGLIFTTLFALGVILATLLTRDAHIGTEAVMGNVDALQASDAFLVYVILSINCFLFVLFFKEYKITTFDGALSKAMGISPIFFNYLLMTQVSLTSIGGFRSVGVLMILAFFTGPALAARLLTHDLKKMLFLSMGIGTAASLIGVAISRHMLSVYGVALSTSGIIVCVILLLFALACMMRRK